MSKKTFSVIVADPPWNFSDKLNMSDVKRGATANYQTMSIADIKQLPIKEIADPNGALLALWVPSAILQDGLDVMKEYSFVQKQTYIWNKTKKEPFKDLIETLKQGFTFCIQKEYQDFLKEKFSSFNLLDILSFGMGRLTRACHEVCLIGINNTKIYQQLQNKSQRSVCFAPNLKHSAKPENLQDSLELMFPDAFKNDKCLELFARRQRPGWTCLGNQTGTCKDIRESLAELA